MTDDLNDFELALVGSPLFGRAVQRVDLDDSGEGIVEMPSGDPVSDWLAARALVDQTGRWPIVVDEPAADALTRALYPDPSETPTSVLREADRMDEAVLDSLTSLAIFSDDWDHTLQAAFDETQSRVGEAPDPAVVLEGVADGDVVSLEGRLMRWEEERRPTTRPEMGELHDPSFDGETGLLFLPIDDSSATPAYLGYFKCSGPDLHHAHLVKAMRRWRVRHGAVAYTRLYAGTQMHLHVDRPPSSLEEAFVIAVELRIFSDPEESLRTTARSLLGNGSWALETRL